MIGSWRAPCLPKSASTRSSLGCVQQLGTRSSTKLAKGSLHLDWGPATTVKNLLDEWVGCRDVVGGVLPAELAGLVVYARGEQAIGQSLGEHVGEGVLGEVRNQRLLRRGVEVPDALRNVGSP